MSVLLLVLGIVLVICLIIVHEFGHFVMARRNGVEVEEFGIFFPPRLYSHTTKAGWVFSINALPLGGFVKLKGERDSDTAPGTLGAASLSAKAKILLAGVTMNFITCLVLLTILAVIGMPQIFNNQYTDKSNTKLISQKVMVTGVVKGSPAYKAGLQYGDDLTKFVLPNKQQSAVIQNSNDLKSIAQKFAGKEVIVHYTQSGTPKQVNVHFLARNNKNQYQLGVATQQLNITRSTWSAPWMAIRISAQLIVDTIHALGHALAGLGSLIAGVATHNKTARQNGQTAATTSVGGPVRIYQLLSIASTLGYQSVLFIVAYISLALGFFNALPMPIVDGGKLYTAIITRLLKRPLPAQWEDAINLATLFVLVCLLILISIADVKNYH